LQVLMEQKRLKIARGTRETERLVRELESMTATGASGEHDDLVIAVALACWRAKRASGLFGTHRLLGIPLKPGFLKKPNNGRCRLRAATVMERFLCFSTANVGAEEVVNGGGI
jgi:hypothetical protein